MPGHCTYTVLLYHGVHADELRVGRRNSSGKHMPRSRFATDMKYVAENFPLLTVREIAAAHRNGTSLREGGIAVTLDDGYLNNHTEAWPVLEEFGVPATIYLATGFIGTGRMIWTDRLEACFLGNARERLAIEAAGYELRYPLTDEDERVAAFLAVKALCKALPNKEKDAVIEAVVRALDDAPEPDHSLYAFMDWERVREMAASPLIDIGAHTVDHVSLAKVPLDEMRSQIDRSVAMVEREVGHACKLFSYPEGMADDFNDQVIDHLRQRGFDHAPSAIEGVNDLEETDPFHIHRIMVGFEGRPFPDIPSRRQVVS